MLCADRNDGSNTQVQDRHPFTDKAYIPWGADLKTIRFENAKLVRVPAKMRYTSDGGYCSELAFRDPGGSMYCPSVKAESPVAAYEVSYSFNAPPMASDESAGGRFTFQVYFHPEELTPQVRETLSARKRNRAKIAEYFAVNAYRETLRVAAVDNGHSRFCEGNYVDGNWIQSDPRCSDVIAHRTITVPSDFITVRVDPNSSHHAPATIATR
jgi:hypothetical protein